jgi:hypothetical protein
VPFIGDVVGVGDGPQTAPRGGEAWGRGADAAVGRHGRGAHGRRTCERCATGVEIGERQH